ncbi:hypothetical protein IAU60_003073 [Kwoniella sp. DSM 27419]
MDLGAPIGGGIGHRNTVPQSGFDQGEHGAGTGLSGGHGHATSQNTQSGGVSGAINTDLPGQTQSHSHSHHSHEQSGLTSGGLNQHSGLTQGGLNQSSTGDFGAADVTREQAVGQGQSHSNANNYVNFEGGRENEDRKTSTFSKWTGEDRHAVGAQESGHTGTPIADKFTGGSSHGTHGSDAVSGAYAGSGARDGLTGQSDAHRTGAGVGVGGENLTTHSHHSGEHHHGARDAALAGTAGGAIAGAEASHHHHSGHHSGSAATTSAPLDRGDGVAGVSGGLVPGVGGESHSGVGSGGDKVQYDRVPGQQGSHSQTGSHGLGAAGAAAGVGAGAGAAGLASGHRAEGLSTGPESRGQEVDSNLRSANDASGGGLGKYGNASGHDNQGKPLIDPKELDTGGPHSLVFHNGQYIHRRDLEGSTAAGTAATGAQHASAGTHANTGAQDKHTADTRGI